MKLIRGDYVQFVPASHEDPKHPGVLKKVLFDKLAIPIGSVQMINWANLEVGKSFAAHYHEDMSEIFIIISGNVEINVDGNIARLQKGDAVAIDEREVHEMKNTSSLVCEYLAIGFSCGKGGKTICVSKNPAECDFRRGF